ncbi:hypothetical protein N7G274_006398 [Stereocaulon virgatum]|uniref:F-box domain-containing protein n=1 Tax=Stereocaulon virgatum TaxID=373712 RepID=A0ABR4A541_9LECA
MSTPPSACLPGEIIVLIFKSLDSFPSVAALCRISRVFYDIWRLNARYICHAIVGPDAVEVARLQEVAAESDREVLLTDPSTEGLGTFHAKVISDATILAANDRHVRLVGKLWEKEVTLLCTQWGARKMIFSGKERIRFQRAYYRFWVLIASHYASQSVTKRLGAMTLRDFEGVRQVADWMQFGFSWDALVQLDIVTAQTYANPRIENHQSGCLLMNSDWHIVCGEIDEERRERRLDRLVDHEIVALDVGFPRDVPLLVWNFFDETQQYLDLIPEIC